MSIHTAVAVPGGILILAGIWDGRTRRIPHAFPLMLLGWAVASRVLGVQAADWWGLVLGLGVGLVIGAGSFALGAMGGGDAKLLAALGAVLGPLATLLVFAYIAVVGGLIALAARLRGRRSIVYGPAIAIGYALAVYLA